MSDALKTLSGVGTGQAPPIVYPRADLRSLQLSLTSVIEALGTVRQQLLTFDEGLNAIAGTTRPGGAAVWWHGPWSSAATYERGDMVTDSGGTYVADKKTTGQPSATPADWTQV